MKYQYGERGGFWKSDYRISESVLQMSPIAEALVEKIKRPSKT